METKKCEDCNGTGEFVIPACQEAGEIVDEQVEICSLCNGSGEIDN